jgi:hypothetical protein
MSENNMKMMPIMTSMPSKEDTRAKKLERKTDASMSKQTYVAFGLNAYE